MTDTGAIAPAVSLRRNAVWALLGNVGYAACQWAILVVIAKLGTAADVGRFALGLALTAPVVTFTNLGLRVLQATDARDDSSFGAYLGLRLASSVLALLMVAVLGVVLGYRGSTLALILALGVAKGVEAVNDVFFGLFQKLENLRRIALSMLVKGVVSVAAVAFGLRLTGDLTLATLAMALAWTVLLLVQDVPVAARITSLRPVFAPARLRPLIRVAFPAGCVSSLGSLTVNVPRYAIERQLGAVALGHFAAMAYVLVAATQPVLALATTVSARLGRSFHADRVAYRRLARQTLLAAGAFGVVGVVAAVLGGRRFLAVAYGVAYAEHVDVLVWLAAAAGASFAAAALSVAVTAARRLGEQSAIGLLALAVCGIASTILVPRFGLLGAAWAVLATEASRLACLAALYLRAAAARRLPRPAPRTVLAAGHSVDVSR